MDDKSQAYQEEKGGCDAPDLASDTKNKTLDDAGQETPKEDANISEEIDESVGENCQSSSVTQETESNIQRLAEEETENNDHDDGERDGGGGGSGDDDGHGGIDGGAGDESPGDAKNSNNPGDSPSSTMDNNHQESKEQDHHDPLDDQDIGKTTLSISQMKADKDEYSTANLADDTAGENDKSNQSRASVQLNKGDSTTDNDEKLVDSLENTTDDSKHVLADQSLPPPIPEENPGDTGDGIAGGHKNVFSHFKQTNDPKKKLQASASLDTGLGENPPVQKPLFYDKSRRIGLTENSNPAFYSPVSVPNGAVHALKEIAKVTKHGAKDSTIQNRQVMSVKTKHYPDRSAQKLLSDRRDRVIESLMRKEGQMKNAPYAYGKFSPIKTDKLPEFRGTAGARGGPKKSPLFNLMNEPFNVATNKRTLERRRLRLSREIAALDMLPEGNSIKPDELLKPVDKDATRGVTTTARSSLLGKVRERKLRSETKKELLLRRRKTPRISDYNKYTFELSSTGYRPKRTVPKVLPKLGHYIKRDGSVKKDEKRTDNKEEDNENKQPNKKEGKHVSFGPICILNIDEEFAMFIQANRKPFKNAYRAKLRRQQATDNGFAGGKYGQLSPVIRKHTKSTITDKSFSTEKKEVPQFTAKPVSTLPKIGQSKPDIKVSESENTDKEVPKPGDDVNVPKTQALPEKKPNKSILKIAKYQPPDVTLNAKCSPEFRAIMDSLHGVNPSPFLLK